jgi:hypothetical protein
MTQAKNWAKDHARWRALYKTSTLIGRRGPDNYILHMELRHAQRGQKLVNGWPFLNGKF